jgi:thioredoxin-dependent peroxiredoxin
MASITLKGNTIHTLGTLPKIGENAPDVTLVKNDLSRVSLKDFLGFRVVLNIFPSIDTGTCATSVRTFNKKAGEFKNTKILCISRDLPYAHRRFCGAEGIESVITLSDFVSGEFGKKYQLEIIDGTMAGLHSRCIIVLDEKGKVISTEQVAETSQEPNYDAVLNLLK